MGKAVTTKPSLAERFKKAGRAEQPSAVAPFPRIKKTKIYWAGYVDDKLYEDLWWGSLPIVNLYKSKKGAKEVYQDVRKVMLVEIK